LLASLCHQTFAALRGNRYNPFRNCTAMLYSIN
jgi:hypothetical protein